MNADPFPDDDATPPARPGPFTLKNIAIGVFALCVLGVLGPIIGMAFFEMAEPQIRQAVAVVHDPEKLGSMVTITGTVDGSWEVDAPIQIGNPPEVRPTVFLSRNGNEIYCFFPIGSGGDWLNRLKKGEEATIEGTVFAKTDTSLWLRECKLR